MKTLTLALFAALSFSTLAAAEKDRHVVVISLDGFPAYLWREPDLPVPNLRKLAAEGASAEAMTVTTPASTWSSHTSMITSRSPRAHGVFFNGQVIVPGAGRAPYIEQWVDKDGFVLVPTLYDIAYRAGLTVAESDWVAITRAKTVTWSFPEIPHVDGRVEQELMAAGLITPEQIGWMEHKPGRKSIVWHDEMWTKAACFMFEQHQPNLLLFHPLTTDSVHHTYGPGTLASYAGLAFADRLVGELVATVDRSGLREKTTFIVMTDHGFKKISQAIKVNVALKKAGYLHADGATLTDAAVASRSMGGTAFVYITDRARVAELRPKLAALLSSLDGVARVLDGSENPQLGLPTPDENPRAGDFTLVAKDGYYFNDSAAGEDVVGPATGYGGTHGYPASDPDMDGIFIASGAQIKKGVTLPRVRNLDLAPTIARILSIDLPEAEGRVLTEILTSSSAETPSARR